MKPIRIESGVIVYYGNRVGRVTDGRAVVDPMFEGPELNAFLEKQPNIRDVKWTDGMFDRLMSGPKDTREIPVLKNCRIWQLQPDVDVRMKFIGYEELCRDFGPPNPDNYRMVYDGAVETNSLEALYDEFRNSLPSNCVGHVLSISDVLELYDENGSSFHYVDRTGFQSIEFKESLFVLEETDPALGFYERIDQEYDAFLKQMEQKPKAELIQKAAEIAQMTAIYNTLRDNVYLSFDAADTLKQMERPMEAIRNYLPKTPMISEDEILDAYQRAGTDNSYQAVIQAPTMQL